MKTWSEKLKTFKEYVLFSASETLLDPGPYPKKVIFQNIDLALSGKEDIQLVSLVVYIYMCVC